MIKRDVTVQGLDTKGAAEAVKIANGFKSEIFFLSGNKCVNAKSLMGLIALGLKASQNITISADGTDEADALSALISFFETKR